MENLESQLRRALQGNLPGQDAQYQMAPLNRGRISIEEIKAGKYRPSAVMVLFCEDNDGEWYIPLIERNSYDGVHSSQISLPGGKFDPDDEDLKNTAVRECYEEIGVKDIEVLGKLTQLFIPVSGFMIDPFVGICKTKDPVLTNHEREVKTIIKLKIANLLTDQIENEGTIDVNGMKIKARWYEVQGHKVWGATAMILSELKTIMKISG